jgi:hypothetical protein
MKMIDPRIAKLLRFAEYARESHLWPVAGGALDQNPAFIEAESLIRSDRHAWRNHFGLD